MDFSTVKSGEEYASEARMLCSQLRADDISYADAHYRRELARQVFGLMYSKEHGEKIVNNIKSFFSWVFQIAVILIGVVGTFVTIVLGTLKVGSLSRFRVSTPASRIMHLAVP